MRNTFIILAALIGIARAASAQQMPDMLSERGAIGLAIGPASWGGDEHAAGPATDVTMYADAPLLPGVRIRGEAGRATWRLVEREMPGARQDGVTLKNGSISALWISRHAVRHFIPYAGLGYGVYHYSARDESIRHPWKGGIQALAAFEVITPGERYAIDTEVRLRLIEGIQQVPVNSSAVATLDVHIGVKLRF